MAFDINVVLGGVEQGSQYERQLRRLTDQGKEVEAIEQAVRGAVDNVASDVRSFVVYGEPQSGKTEMMICLTAKFLDLGYDFILHLLNDSVDLLGQNLGRFRDAGIAPTATNFTEIVDPVVKIQGQRHVVFAKKNGSDLTKVINKIGSLKRILIIDDEADFASPNAKVNSGERTKINDKITRLLSNEGTYIGVTATPARLDLNNTFDNDSGRWVNFPPHSQYTGQDVFFPLDEPPRYRLVQLPPNSDDPKYARDALFRFMVSVAYLNNYSNGLEQNYSMLIHTSGIRADHKSDWAVINATLDVLKDKASSKFENYVHRIWELAGQVYPDADANRICAYIVQNITRNSIVVLNSGRDKTGTTSATSPQTLFTIIIGGNIVSRGVTFDNLLSMYFTRDVKHKIQQDTYVQRARMFGSRGRYLSHFELTIPRGLYDDWHRCFVFHKLALEAIREGVGSPVWLSDHRISAVSSGSIDKSTVDMNRGEMSFPIAKIDPDALTAIAEGDVSEYAKMDALATALGSDAFPSYLARYIHRVRPVGDASLAVLPPTSIAKYRDADGLDRAAIERRKGFFGTSQMERPAHPRAVHFLKVFYNADGNGRMFYKFEGSIQFTKNDR